MYAVSSSIVVFLVQFRPLKKQRYSRQCVDSRVNTQSKLYSIYAVTILLLLQVSLSLLTTDCYSFIVIIVFAGSCFANNGQIVFLIRNSSNRY